MARRLKWPMCGATYVCKGGIECWCAYVAVSTQKLEAIRELYDDCVCPDCLRG